jgi:hypothetical protein
MRKEMRNNSKDKAYIVTGPTRTGHALALELAKHGMGEL